MEQKFVRMPFDVELAKKITNGEVKGRVLRKIDKANVRIVCFDQKYEGDYLLSCLVLLKTGEGFSAYKKNGKCLSDERDDYDLMLEVPEYMTFKDGDIIAYDDNDSIVILKGEPIINDDGFTSFNFYVDMYKNDLNFYTKKVSLCVNGARKATPEEIEKLKDRLLKDDRQEAKECLKKFFGIEQKQEYVLNFRDMVLVRSTDKDKWCVAEFSHKDGKWYAVFGGLYYEKCIPYNDQTAHLIGTTDNWE